MTTEELEIGATVMLRSGGPIMTIMSTYGALCMCGWFDGASYKDEWFKAAVLIRIPSPFVGLPV